MTAQYAAFIKAEIKKAKWLQGLSREAQIAAMCEEAQCSDKIKKVHEQQFLRRHWNPHPSERFQRWWMNRGKEDSQRATGSAWSDIDSVRAYNCERVREVWREHLCEERDELRRFEEGDEAEIPF